MNPDPEIYGIQKQSNDLPQTFLTKAEWTFLFDGLIPWEHTKIIRTRKCGSDYSSLVRRKGLVADLSSTNHKVAMGPYPSPNLPPAGWI